MIYVPEKKQITRLLQDILVGKRFHAKAAKGFSMLSSLRFLRVFIFALFAKSKKSHVKICTRSTQR